MSPPQTIAHYRITAKLGEGGMGEVWRATDTKLNRDVAIKILPEAFAQDPDRMARFTREAQVLASLNHPNIATIYGVEERALIMELVEGETLHGPLPVDTALDYARQIAEALEYAHERGIVHRDLKPANIKVTPEGRVKVLDFGLAKAMSSDAASGNPESSPTLTMRATMAGVIMGTAAYMSPEQARGQEADRRADIWAFGVVLYEILTGRQLFAGLTISDTLAAVLKTEPDLAGVPAQVRPIVERCLRKDPRRRWQAIGDVRLALEDGAPAAPLATLAQQRLSKLPWVVAAALLLALIGLAVVYFREPSEPSYQASLLPPEKAVFTPVTLSSGGFALSPDGRALAFVATQDNRTLLWIRRLDALTAHPLAGTDNAYYPFWSPDNRFVGFFMDDKLKKIEVTGGPPHVICEAGLGRGGSWNQEGTIIFAGLDRTVHRVSAAGGQPVKLTAMDAASAENAHYWPSFLPDGRHFLYAVRRALDENSAIFAGSIDARPGPEQRLELVKTLLNGVYAPPGGPDWIGRAGWLMYLRENTLFAQRFDTAKLKLEGEAVPAAENVGSVRGAMLAGFSVSARGVLVRHARRPALRGHHRRGGCWSAAADSAHQLAGEAAEMTLV